MKRTIALSGALLVLACLGPGCAGLAKALLSDDNADLVNFAAADLGARVSASHEEGGHAAASVINGITDGTLWDSGEGWSSGTALKHREIGGESGVSGKGWGFEDIVLEIDFGRTRRIHRIVVHTLDSKTHPRIKYGVRGYRLEYRSKGAWQPLTNASNVETAIITHAFTPVEADRIRLITDARNANDFTETPKGPEDSRGITHYDIKGSFRLIELEAFGFKE